MIKIIPVNKKLFSSKYLKDRNLFWDKKVSEFKKCGVPLWNGSVYYIKKLQNDVAYMGLGEYRDLIFVEKKNIQKVKDKYNINFNFTFANVQILLESNNNNYLFGTKKIGGQFEIISVGGSLRYENGTRIRNLYDIKEYARKEMLIETKIKIDQAKLKFIDIIINNNICTFLFNYKIKNTAVPLLNKGEFEGETYINKDIIINSKKIQKHPRLASINDFLEKKWKNKKL